MVAAAQVNRLAHTWEARELHGFETEHGIELRESRTVDKVKKIRDWLLSPREVVSVANGV